ncbi:MAG TPA: M28 family peptidase [Gemmatimonadaceae bacterium]|nr:M28 family peptidase [Gemmatimonadaceae bacterium]
MRNSAWLNALALLCVVALALLYANHVPPVVPASAPPTEFSAERAIEHVRAIAQRPHPTGSVDHARVLQYITTQLGALGILTSVQAAIGIGTKYPVAGEVRNIVARLHGSEPGPAVLLMAHYDGVPAAPAAGDDASGSAVLLETLRALKAGGTLRHDVIALFTDSEEVGLLGAAAFAREHPWAKDVGVILNFEARGTKGPSLMFETGAGNADVVSVLRRIGGARATSLSTAVYRALPNDTDLSEMMLLGKPAMNFAFIGGVERYHTAEDDIEHLSVGSVQDHGDQAVALAREFANGPLPRPVTSDAVFFDFPGLGIIAYPEWLAIVIAVLTLVLVLLAGVQLRRMGVTVGKDAALGATAFVFSLLVACGAAFGLATLLASLHAGFEQGGAPQWRGIYAAAAVLLTAAVVSATYALARRVASAAGIALGAMAIVCVVALGAALAAPGVSFLLTWPAFFAASASLAALVMRSSVIGFVKSSVAVTVTLFLMVPTIYLMVCVALGLDGIGASALAILTTISLWVLAPQLEAMTSRSRWMPAGLAAIGATVLVAIGLATVRTDADRPAGAALVYAVDADSQTAWFAGSGTTPAVRAWVERVAGGLPRQGNASAPVWLRRMYPASRIAQLPLADIASPTAEVFGDTSAAGMRTMTIRVRGGAGARSVVLMVEEGNADSLYVAGRVVSRARYRSQGARTTLEFISPPDTGFVIRLSLSSQGPVALGLMSRHARAGTPPGVAMPMRPSGVLPIQLGDASYVYRRVQIGSN